MWFCFLMKWVCEYAFDFRDNTEKQNRLLIPRHALAFCLTFFSRTDFFDRGCVHPKHVGADYMTGGCVSEV